MQFTITLREVEVLSIGITRHGNEWLEGYAAGRFDRRDAEKRDPENDEPVAFAYLNGRPLGVSEAYRFLADVDDDDTDGDDAEYDDDGEGLDASVLEEWPDDIADLDWVDG